MGLRALAVLLALGWSCSASAYKVDQHGTITQKAGERLAVCVPDWKQAWTDRLEKGNVAQDSYSIERAVNWHFYDGGDALRTGMFFHRNLHRAYRKRKLTLDRRLSKERKLEAIVFSTGAVLHYIQDMSVPLHVVPVFHVTGAPFENTEYDDSELPAGLDCDALLARVEAVEKQCDGFSRCVAQNVLEQSAQVTVVATREWPSHWVANGSDGCLDGQRQGHGAQKVGFGCHGDTLWGEGDPQGEAAFFTERYLQAVDASLVMMLYMHRRLANQ